MTRSFRDKLKVPFSFSNSAPPPCYIHERPIFTTHSHIHQPPYHRLVFLPFLPVIVALVTLTPQTLPLELVPLCSVPRRPDTSETKLTTPILLLIPRKQHHLIFKNISPQSIRAHYQQWLVVTRHTIRISQQAQEHQEESILGRMVGIREQLRCKR